MFSALFMASARSLIRDRTFDLSGPSLTEQDAGGTDTATRNTNEMEKNEESTGTTGTISRKLESALFQSQFADMEFTIGKEKEIVPAHSLIMSINSGKYATGGVSLELDWIEPTPFRNFLKYLYTDLIDVGVEEAVWILLVAKYFEVFGLVEICTRKVKTGLEVNNAASIYRILHLHPLGLDELKESVRMFSVRHADQICQTDGFLHLPVDCINSILQAPDRGIDNVSAFRSILRWATKQISDNGIVGQLPVLQCDEMYNSRLRAIVQPLVHLVDFTQFTHKEYSLYVVPAKIFPDKEALNTLAQLCLREENANAEVEPVDAIAMEMENNNNALVIHVSRDFAIRFGASMTSGEIHVHTIAPYLAFVNGRFVVGEDAQAAQNSIQLKWTCNVAEKHKILVHGVEMEMNWEDILCLFLAKCREIVEKDIGELISSCLLVVPTNIFKCGDHEALKKYATRAGLLEVKLISEPTAVAYDYFINEFETAEIGEMKTENILVVYTGIDGVTEYVLYSLSSDPDTRVVNKLRIDDNRLCSVGSAGQKRTYLSFLIECTGLNQRDIAKIVVAGDSGAVVKKWRGSGGIFNKVRISSRIDFENSLLTGALELAHVWKDEDWKESMVQESVEYENHQLGVVRDDYAALDESNVDLDLYTEPNESEITTDSDSSSEDDIELDEDPDGCLRARLQIPINYYYRM